MHHDQHMLMTAPYLLHLNPYQLHAASQWKIPVALCHSLLLVFYQVLGLYWSWRQVGSPGMFTRIACCNIETLEVRVLS